MKSDYMKHPERAKQVIDFTGLKIGKLYPTDIDCLCEWKDKAYVLIELKHAGAEVSVGQWIALKRMADDFRKLGKESIIIIAEHYVHECKEDVDLSQCAVRAYYRNGTLYRYDGKVKDLYLEFIRSIDGGEEDVYQEGNG